MFRRLTPLQLGIDLGVAGVFAIIAVPLALGAPSTLPFDGVGARAAVVLGSGLYPLLLTAALALWRLAPSLALTAAWCGALVQMGIGQTPGFADLAILVALFGTAAYGGRLTYWVGLASSVAGALVGSVFVALTYYYGFVPAYWPAALGVIFLAGLFTLAVPWGAGAVARTRIQARADRRTATEATALATASSERERIARDMHDVVAHSLAVVIAQADGARYASSTDPDAAPAALATISTTARAALADVRLLLTQLRHRQGDGPQPAIADLDSLYEQMRAAGMALEVEIDPAPPGIPPAGVQLAVYRILQEALTNALRHGGGSPVWVRLAWHADRVEISVRNGVPVGAVAHSGGHGLVGMTERARLTGGTISAGEQNDQFVVEASLPIGAAT